MPHKSNSSKALAEDLDIILFFVQVKERVPRELVASFFEFVTRVHSFPVVFCHEFFKFMVKFTHGSKRFIQSAQVKLLPDRLVEPFSVAVGPWMGDFSYAMYNGISDQESGEVMVTFPPKTVPLAIRVGMC